MWNCSKCGYVTEHWNSLYDASFPNQAEAGVTAKNAARAQRSALLLHLEQVHNGVFDEDEQ